MKKTVRVPFVLISIGILLVSPLMNFVSLATTTTKKNTAKAVIAVLDTGSGSPHEAELLKVLKKELASCHKCEVKTFPIYDQQGNLYLKTFLGALKAAQKNGARVIHLSWNVRADALWESTVAKMVVALDEVGSKAVVVAAAGDASESEDKSKPRESLSQTVMAQVKHAFIIGELSENGKPLRGAWKGAELLTSIQPPAGTKGSSFSSLLFSAALLKMWSEHPELSAEQVRLMVRKNRELSPDAFPKYEDLARYRKPFESKN